MAISADGQAEVRSLLMGTGTSYRLLIDEWDGWLDQEPKTADLDLLGDGLSGGVDRYASVPKVLKVMMQDPSVDTLNDAFTAAWALGGDTEFHWQLDGIERYIVGRTRRKKVIEQDRGAHLLVVRAEFVPMDPTIHVVP